MVRDFPYLKGYLALRLDVSDARVKKLLQGQVVVGQYSDGYRLRDGTGVQTALVLDAAVRQGRQEADVRDRLER